MGPVLGRKLEPSENRIEKIVQVKGYEGPEVGKG
jgi:hypothetical protein